MTIRITSPYDDMKLSITMDKPPVDESDAESFHSAISNVTKHICRHRITKPADDHDDANVVSDSTIKHVLTPTRPRSSTTSSHSPTTPPKSSRPKHSRQKSLPTVPRRHSSLLVGADQFQYQHQRSTPRRPRKDSTALHQQSCRLFSSLDGMLSTVSREITPLPSVASSTRTTTRHASLVPTDGTYDAETIQRICKKIDARLVKASAGATVNVTDHGTQHPPENPFAYSSSYPYALPSPPLSPSNFGENGGSDSIDNSPALPSGRFSRNITDEHEHSALLARSLSITAPTVKSHTSASVQGQRPHLNTVISWTSNASRRAEYEKIDRAHSGVRGVARKIWPTCLKGRDARRGFYTGECDGGSVRRFRMDVDDGDQRDGDGSDTESVIGDEDEGEEYLQRRRRQGEGPSEREVETDIDIDEKTALRGVHAGNYGITGISPLTKDAETTKNNSKSKSKTKTKLKGKKPWWSCFEL